MLLRPLAHDADAQVRRLVAGAGAELPVGPDGPAGVPILRVLAADPDPACVHVFSALLVQLLPLSARVEEGTLTKSQAAEQEKKEAEQHTSETKSKPAEEGNEKLVLPPPAPNPTWPAGKTMSPRLPTVHRGLASSRSRVPPPSNTRARSRALAEDWRRADQGRGGQAHRPCASGIQKVEVKDKETLTVTISESQVEKLAAAGLEALGKKDLKKAQKLLEKATTLCNKEKKLRRAAMNFDRDPVLAGPALSGAGQAAAGDELVSAGCRPGKLGEGTRRPVAAAQRAAKELAPNLGRVIFPKKSKKSCQEVTLYMLPGTHQIEVDGESQTVKVRGQRPCAWARARSGQPS